MNSHNFERAEAGSPPRRSAFAQVLGIVAAVPNNVITNDDCPDPAAAHEAGKMTGVLERRWVRPCQTASDLCMDAARHLLKGMQWSGSQLDVIVYVTQTPTQAVPADVYRMAAELGAPSHCMCLQVNWSCAGYVNGLLLAMRLLHPGQRALLLVGDATSTICDPDDRATAPLFGDAGSATAIEWGGPSQNFVLGTDGMGADKLCTLPGIFTDDHGETWKDGLRMDGAAVFNFALKHVPSMMSEVLEEGRPDWLFFHQANKFMLDHLIKKAKLLDRFESHQIPMNLQRFGNCSCASIPLLMCDAPAAMLRAVPSRVALIGFGAGWAWAGASLQLGGLEVCELIEV